LVAGFKNKFMGFIPEYFVIFIREKREKSRWHSALNKGNLRNKFIDRVES